MIARILTTALALALVAPLAGAADPPGRVDFNRQVRPILSEHCLACHGPDEEARESGLRLDLRDAATAPADSGRPAIVPGKPGESGLIARVESRRQGMVMPPPSANRPLSDADRATLRAWIEQGADYRTHWAFVPPRRPPAPAVNREGWPRGAIDRFLLARIEAEGLAPSPEADRTTLVRRLTLDLTGLPPSPEEVDAFEADCRPDAYDRLVDRLLASPRFGERMALDWLDAARFADTHGYHIDSGRDMTRWRDWVIDAYNTNLPFDRFTVEQVAGDLLPDATAGQKIASGFHRNHMINFEGGAIPEEYHNAYVVDRVNTTGTVWLGLTVGCAQCHDHKFDPISQREYYGLYAFFHNVPENGLDGSKGNATPTLPVPTEAQRRDLDRLSAAVAEAEAALAAPRPGLDAGALAWESAATGEAVRPGVAIPLALATVLAKFPGARTDADRAAIRSHYRTAVDPEGRALAARLASLRAERAAVAARVPTVMVMGEMPRPRDTFILKRGQYDQKGEPVAAGVPASLPPLPPGAKADRLALARWLVAPEHPLTARVAVNRAWQAFFGTGLVRTADDFGSQGDPPSHPELLDWLAVEFRESGWDVKGLVRRIVTSSAYRQSSRSTPEGLAKDPEDRLLARAPRLRLPAEFIRDGALAASGLLDGRIGGASVSPYQPPGLWEELASRSDGKNWSAQEYVQSHGHDLYRRTMYTFWKRTSPPPTLVTFDAPDRETCTVRRARTNTPLQALVLLNDPTYVEASRKLAERVVRESGPGDDPRIDLAFRLALARRPTPRERDVLRRVRRDALARYRADRPAALKLLAVGESPRDPAIDEADLAAWAAVAGVILNLDEAVTRG